MIEIRPFEAADLRWVRVRDEHTPVLEMILEHEDALEQVEGPYAYTAWTPYGTSVASCGILENGEAWAFVDPDMPRSAVLAVCRKVQEVLEEHLLREGPVFARVRCDVPAAVTWARWLGFTKVGFGSQWVYR